MKIIVQKYGGSIFSSSEDIKKASHCVKHEIDKGNKVIVVVSALKGLTDTLISYTKECIGDKYQHKFSESTDFVISAGEQVSAGLFTLSLKSQQIDAIALSAWQVPIYTNDEYGNAKIVSINTEKIIHFIKQGIIPIITGFQGIYKDTITTIGRGGSDTTAVALAAAVKADLCQIFTDVDGVYRCDPNLYHNNDVIPYLSYDDAILLSAKGFKVLYHEAMKIAYNYNIDIKILTTQSKKGTFIMSNDKIKKFNIENKIVINNIICSKSMYFINTTHDILLNNNKIDLYYLSRTEKNHIFMLSDDDFSKVFPCLDEKSIFYKNTVIITIVGMFDSKFYKTIVDFMNNNNINLYFLNFTDYHTISIVLDCINVNVLIDKIYKISEELVL